MPIISEIDSNVKELLKAIVIAKHTGEYLFDLILDSEINPILLSSFVGALGLFGKDSLGKIEEINIKGLDVDMVIVYKYDLVLIIILDKNFPKSEEIRLEAEIALDMFYTTYLDINNANACIDTFVFSDFRKILIIQINKFFQQINEQEGEIPDFGFFTEAIKRMKGSKGFRTL
ncbi:MAG: hypothetical protein ACTSR8_18135 [Promethearchaeota archaeon]